MPSQDSSLNSKNSIHSIIIALAVLNAVGLFALYVKIDQLSSPRRIQTMMYKQGERMENDTSFGMPPLKERMMIGSGQFKDGSGAPLMNKGLLDASNTSSTPWITYKEWDLSFKYPKGWYASSFKDFPTSQQNNIRLTDHPGQLRLGGGPGYEGVVYFEKGFQAEFRIEDGRDFVQLGPTAYPNIQKNITECEEAGCPTAEYIYTGKNNAYRLTFNWVGDDAVYQPVIENILASLQEK